MEKLPHDLLGSAYLLLLALEGQDIAAEKEVAPQLPFELPESRIL